MQVTDSPTPTVADIKRQLNNAGHELDQLATVSGMQEAYTADVLAAQHRVREAVAHLEAAEKKTR